MKGYATAEGYMGYVEDEYIDVYKRQVYFFTYITNVQIPK